MDIASKPSLILGLTEKGPGVQRYEGQASLVTVAQTGSGKDQCVILPNLIRFPGSIIITDPKGEDAENCAAWRASRLGQRVHVFDPFGVVNPDMLPPGSLAKFNPLDLVRNSITPAEDAIQVAAALIISSSHDPHWSDGARALLAGFLVYVALDPNLPPHWPRNVRTVWNLISQGKEDFKGTLDLMSLSEVADGFAARQATVFLGNDNEKETGSFLSSLRTNCGSIFNSPAILDNMSESTIDFAELQNPATPASVFLVLPGKFSQTHGRWFRLLLCCAFSQIEGSGLAPNHGKGAGTVFFLNEFFTLGKFEQLVEAMGRMRGYGIKFWTFVQNLTQLKELYGENGWMNILGNAAVLQYFGGTMDEFTAQKISALSGKRTVPTVSGSTTFGPQGSETISTSETGRDVRMPDEIMQYPQGFQWVSRSDGSPYAARMVYAYKDFPDHAAFIADLRRRARPYSARHGFGAAPAAPPPGGAVPLQSPFEAWQSGPSARERRNASKPSAPSAPSPGWRAVKPGEIFQPGCEFRLNVTTGGQEVREASIPPPSSKAAE